MRGNGVASSIPTHSRQTVEIIFSISPNRSSSVGEGQLDVELGDLLDAVGAEILVAEADRDLVVALEAGDHEQLLGDLRRLRQRVEAAPLQPRWGRGSRARPRASASRGSASGCRRSRPPPSRGGSSRPSSRAGGCCAAACRGAGRASGSGGARCRRRSPRRAGTAAASSARGSPARPPAPRSRPSPCPGSRSRASVRRPCRAARSDELVAQLVREPPRRPAELSGLITSWTTPPSSRRSTKTSPPWSRRASTQPASVSSLPDVPARELAAQAVPPGRHGRA